MNGLSSFMMIPNSSTMGVHIKKSVPLLLIPLPLRFILITNPPLPFPLPDDYDE